MISTLKKHNIELQFNANETQVRIIFSDKESPWYYSKNEVFDAITDIARKSLIDMITFTRIRNKVIQAPNLPES